MLWAGQLMARLARLNVRGQMSYTTDFAFSVLQIILLQFGNLALIFVVVDQFSALAGWSFAQIMFLLALRLLSHGLYVVFALEISGSLAQYILRGEFDRFLLKPVHPLILLMFNRIELRGLTDLVSGIVMFAVSSAMLDLSWSLGHILLLVAAVVGAFFIELSVYLLASSTSFWFNNSDALRVVVFQLHEQYLLYPITIYGRPVQYLLTFLLPLAFVNYYPSLFFLDKGASGTALVLVLLTPVVAAVTFFVALTVFHRGVARYESTGS